MMNADANDERQLEGQEDFLSFIIIIHHASSYMLATGYLAKLSTLFLPPSCFVLAAPFVYVTHEKSDDVAVIDAATDNRRDDGESRPATTWYCRLSRLKIALCVANAISNEVS